VCGDKAKPFYTIARLADGMGAAHDVDETEATIENVIEADAQDEVLVVMAHDDSLSLVMAFFPKYANDFKEKGWVEREAVDFEGFCKGCEALGLREVYIITWHSRA
jgi:hypothetical protein